MSEPTSVCARKDGPGERNRSRPAETSSALIVLVGVLVVSASFEYSGEVRLQLGRGGARSTSRR